MREPTVAAFAVPSLVDLAVSMERRNGPSCDLSMLIVLDGSQRLNFGFLIDMNRLLEMFVFRLVDTLLAGSAMRVHYQRVDRSIVLNASTGQPYARVVPDILVERRAADTAARLAIDAKYKLYDERKLSSSDVYQGFLYAYAYGAAGGPALPAALLVYPSSSRSSRAVRLRVRSAQALAAAEILCAWPVYSGRPRRADRADQQPGL